MNQVLLRVRKAETKGTSLSHKLFANTINKLLEDETPPHTHPPKLVWGGETRAALRLNQPHPY